MDVSPKQIVSVATALIPFLEHDDANRALMGSNMMRQSVPLLQPEAPVVGTGVEYRAALDSQGAGGRRAAGGTVVSVTADEIVVERDEGDERDTYRLKKFLRSNQGTCINQRPIVDVGDRVAGGPGPGRLVLDRQGRDGPGPEHPRRLPPLGGRQLRGRHRHQRAPRPRTTCSPRSTSRSTRSRPATRSSAPEEITRDIPNVGEESLRDLDEDGIIYEGAEVQPGDILVGKITPKGETELTAEERLLRAIFGEKAREVRTRPCACPTGSAGSWSTSASSAATAATSCSPA